MSLVETDVGEFSDVSRAFIINEVSSVSNVNPNEFGIPPGNDNAENTTIVMEQIDLTTRSTLVGSAFFRIVLVTYEPAPNIFRSLPANFRGRPNNFDRLAEQPNIQRTNIAVARWAQALGGTQGNQYELDAVTLSADQTHTFPSLPYAWGFNRERGFNWWLRFEIDAAAVGNHYFDLKWKEYSNNPIRR